MGTFASYDGGGVIPEHLRDEFSGRMMKILNYGGMMEFDQISLYGRKLELLKPAALNSNGKAVFHYNYFEDDAWEYAEYDACQNQLWTNKIGYREFNTVVQAAYTLYELYDSSPGLATVNGEIISPCRMVGWLNHLLGAQFTLQHRIDRMWKLAEMYALSNVEDEGSAYFSQSELRSLISTPLLRYAGGTDYTDLCYIVDGTKTLDAADAPKDSYSADILECRNRLTGYFKEKNDTAAAVEDIRKLVCMEISDRQSVTQKELRPVAEMTMFLAARVILYLTAEISGSEFWVDWNDMKDHVYQDEHRKEYAAPELLRLRREMVARPIPGIATSDYLHEDGLFLFSDTPEELKETPKYFVSDDDRLYWWDGSDEVVISDEMDQWLQELAKQYKKIMKDSQSGEKRESEAADDFMKDFFTLLVEIEDRYKRVFPFQEMFYEFIQNGNRKAFKAAVELLRILSEENWEDGKAIKYMKGSWGLSSRKVTFNPGRIRMKRYMSVMANRKLRKQYFGF